MTITKDAYASFLETIPDAAILVNKHGVISLINSNAQNLFGYSKACAINSPISLFIPTEKRELHEKQVSQFMNDPRLRPIHSSREFHGLHADGSVIPLEIMLKPLELEGNDYVLTVARDISERLHHYAELNTILDASVDGFWVLDGDGKFLRVNDAYCEMVGYGREELLNMSIKDVEATESEEEIKARTKDIIEAGRGRFETRHRRKDGELIDIEVSSHFLSDRVEKKFYVFLHDITDRKRAISELSELNHVLLESSSVGFLVYDIDSGNCVLANRASAKIIGADVELLLQQNFRTIASWQGSGLLRMAEKSIQTGKETSIVSHLESTFGKDIYINVNFSTFLQNGKDHLLLSFLDTTQRERARQDLIKAYDATIEGWSRALELRDPDTEGHTRRVTALTLQLAKAMGVKKSKLEHLRRGALLHDIGKMAIPDSILQKPGKLNKAEWKIMRKHPQFAEEMLSPIAYLRPALEIPSSHHEKWDGSGYPEGLREEQIPLAARIFSVIDVWDALRSDRPYRKSWPTDKVLKYIVRNAGVYFDPLIVEGFLALVKKENLDQ